MKIKNFKVFAFFLALIVCVSAFSLAWGNTIAFSLEETDVSPEEPDFIDIPHNIFLKQDSRYEQKYGAIIYIPKGETAGMALAEIDDIIQFVDIYDPDSNKVDENAVIGTGYQAKIYVPQEHTVYDTNIFIVLGDVTCDGNVNTSDLLKIKAAFLESEELNPYLKMAADVTGDDVINGTDYIRIKGYFLGDYELYK